MKVALDGVEETMLIPLCIKAEETKRPNPRIRDVRAVEMINRIDYDFSKFEKKRFSYGGVIARTVIIDREARKFITSYPDAVCINVGCGLDARFYRVDNGRIDWYDLDLPRVMALREGLLPEDERVHRISFSALDEQWAVHVNAGGRPVLIIMEGLLMYFTEDEVRRLLAVLKRHFPGCSILAELTPEFVAKNGKRHETVGKTGAVFRWGVGSGKDVERLCDGLSLTEEWSLNTEMKKYELLFRIIFSLPIVKGFNNRIALYRMVS